MLFDRILTFIEKFSELFIFNFPVFVFCCGFACHKVSRFEIEKFIFK